jgi:hypothetical protein
MKVFPNPFSGQTSLLVSSETPEEFSASVYDLQGRQIRRMSGITGTVLTIPANNISPGVYLLAVSIANSGSVVKLIVQ